MSSPPHALSGRFPAGAYGIVASGVWEKIGKRRYKTVFSYVLSAKDLITRTAKSTTNPCPATTPNPCCPVDPNATYCDGDLLLQGIPVARVRNEIITELSEDCQVLTGAGTISFYAPADTAFEGPHTPTRAITATLRRIQLEFKN